MTLNMNEVVNLMNLYENTTELNEVLDMAKNLPKAGESESAVEEIFYVNGIFDMQTMTFSTDVTYDEIRTAAETGKYIVAKAQAYMGEYNTDIIFLPISDCGLVSGVATFEGMMQINGESLGLPKGLILLAVTVEICNDGKVITRIKSVSTTTIKE